MNWFKAKLREWLGIENLDHFTGCPAIYTKQEITIPMQLQRGITVGLNALNTAESWQEKLETMAHTLSQQHDALEAAKGEIAMLKADYGVRIDRLETLRTDAKPEVVRPGNWRGALREIDNQ